MDEEQSSLIAKGRECIRIEAEALERTAESLNETFAEVVSKIDHTLNSGRKVIFSGVGKSAHIGHKLVGTFNSIGAASTFLDPVNALHGDLGLCQSGDCAILLSNSGATEEIIALVPLLKRFGLSTIALTSRANSPLSQGADQALVYVVPKEACPHDLAPTASTSAALALGDAVAMVLLEKRGFTRDDYARLHPGGNLGRILLLRVTEIMRKGERFPCLPETATIQEAINAMTHAKAGCLAITDKNSGILSGVFTDGDFRRSALTGPDFLTKPVSSFMTKKPITIVANALAVEALKIFEAAKIDDLLVVDATGRPVGLVDGQDLPRFHLV
jgi:arabinose-5-phosphate isomerase